VYSMDLGTKLPKSGEPLSPSAEPKERISYPSFNLNHDVAKKFSEENDCDLGDEYTANITFRVSLLRKDEYGHSIGLEVKSIDDVEEQNAKDDEDAKKADEAEEKTLGYKRTTAKHETPDMSAKSLED